MNSHVHSVFIYGEALFDCFPDGETVLGGAPFNVAWHLQALGDDPAFITRVGHDTLGAQIIGAMNNWDMSTDWVQRDSVHPTGRVIVNVQNDEPHYDIAENSAYDFIDSADILAAPQRGLFYHGTLAARSPVSRRTLQQLTAAPGLDIFIDVNLRPPWWDHAETCQWLERARWVKLNADELRALGFQSADLEQDMVRMHAHYHLDQLIVTLGKDGAIVRDREGQFHRVSPQAATQVVDTVGAGDAFTAMYIHGLRANWPIEKNLERAQAMASRIVAQRGAISDDPNLYADLSI